MALRKRFDPVYDSGEAPPSVQPSLDFHDLFCSTIADRDASAAPSIPLVEVTPPSSDKDEMAVDDSDCARCCLPSVRESLLLSTSTSTTASPARSSSPPPASSSNHLQVPKADPLRSRSRSSSPERSCTECSAEAAYPSYSSTPMSTPDRPNLNATTNSRAATKPSHWDPSHLAQNRSDFKPTPTQAIVLDQSQQAPKPVKIAGPRAVNPNRYVPKFAVHLQAMADAKSKTTVAFQSQVPPKTADVSAALPPAAESLNGRQRRSKSPELGTIQFGKFEMSFDGDLAISERSDMQKFCCSECDFQTDYMDAFVQHGRLHSVVTLPSLRASFPPSSASPSNSPLSLSASLPSLVPNSSSNPIVISHSSSSSTSSTVPSASKIPAVCRVCRVAFNSADQLQAHLRSHELASIDQSNKSAPSAPAHKEPSPSQSSSVAVAPTTSGREKLPSCRYCNQAMPITLLANHEKAHWMEAKRLKQSKKMQLRPSSSSPSAQTSRPFQCPLCVYCTDSKGDLTTHFTVAHCLQQIQMFQSLGALTSVPIKKEEVVESPSAPQEPVTAMIISDQ